MAALRLGDLQEIENIEQKLMSQSDSVESNSDSDKLKEQVILNRSNSQLKLVDLEEIKEYNRLANNLPEVNLTYNFGPVPQDNKTVFFFDIDNCLYKRSTKIHDLMQIYIHRFFKEHLSLDDEEAHKLHMKYYKEYGLAIEGLVRIHKIDALEYNKVVDDALPLDKILKPNPQLRRMFIDLKKSGKVDRLWLYTNAYKNHGLRVIKLLGLGDLFDGMTFCDYSNFPLVCKPMKKSFDNALIDAGVSDPKNTYFVDDSGLNVEAAKKFGWGKIIQFVERDEDMVDLVGNRREEQDDGSNRIHIIRDILKIRDVCPELF